MMSDALKAYKHLCENIPKWIESLEEVSKRSIDKQNDMEKVPVPVTPQLKKSGSTETLKEGQPKDAPQQAQPNGHPASVPPQQPVNRSTPLQQAEGMTAKRKRRTASVLSGRMSGPAKYRSRALVVVYYDSEIQVAFEGLVRSIGAGRNLLRKGKMAARIEAMTEENEESDQEDDDDDDGGFDDDPVMSKIGYRPKLGLPTYRTTRARAGFGGVSNGEDKFDVTDKALEKAQNFCEKGAHQFLRDGDCHNEIKGCRKEFQEAIQLSEQELSKYKAKAEATKRRQEQQQQREEERKKQEQPQVTRITVDPYADKHNTMELEVDSSDGEDDVNMESIRPLRMTSRFSARA